MLEAAGALFIITVVLWGLGIWFPLALLIGSLIGLSVGVLVESR